ncbi:MAG: hypothetical protein LBN95_04185 [Prevotellaceae bacterium]|jgi:hypothetical protein|nr:hypothetical protein [Prevotellaceae bacterium]
MKKFVLFSLIACVSGILSAQKVDKVTFDFNKAQAVGYVISYTDRDVKLVSDAFQNRLEKIYGLKSGKKITGFAGYQNQVLAPIGSYPITVYFKVEEEGKKNAKITKLYFLVCDGAGNLYTPENAPQTLEANVFQFLNDFQPFLVEYDYNLQLVAAQNLLAKQKKDLDGLNKDKVGLQKDKEKIEGKIRDKETEISNKETEIANQEKEVGRIQGLLVR